MLQLGTILEKSPLLPEGGATGAKKSSGEAGGGLGALGTAQLSFGSSGTGCSQPFLSTQNCAHREIPTSTWTTEGKERRKGKELCTAWRGQPHR